MLVFSLLSGSESGGLSGGAITGIVFAVLFVIGGLIVLWSTKGKEWWSKRQSYSWYQTMTHPGQWISWSPPSHTHTTRVSVETTTRARVTPAEETAETATTTTTRVRPYTVINVQFGGWDNGYQCISLLFLLLPLHTATVFIQ